MAVLQRKRTLVGQNASTRQRPSLMLELTLGAEFDANLRRLLVDAVRKLGGTVGASSWSVAGSQEMEVFELRFPSGTVAATEETFMGLVLRGNTELVTAIAMKVRELA